MKYISGKEEHQMVDVAGTRTPSEIQVTTEEHAHEKITSCKKLADKKLESSKSHLGREVSLCEVVWFILRFEYAHCTASFVHAATLPLENRVGIMHRKKNSQFVYDSKADVLLPVHDRVVANLPTWRRFTDSQIMHIEDYVKTPYVLDAGSSFNIRPPELLFVDDFQLYCECFVVVRTLKTVCCIDVTKQAWMDGASRLVKLRECSVTKLVTWVSAKADGGDSVAREMLRLVFQPISSGDRQLVAKFMQATKEREVCYYVHCTVYIQNDLCMLYLGKFIITVA